MSIERRYVTATQTGIELRNNEDGTKTAVGYGSVYYASGDPGTQYALRDDLMERIMPGAFDEAIEGDARALFNHNPNMILGRQSALTMRLSADSHGLRYEIDLPDTTAGRDLAVSIQRGDVTGSSFGFTVATGGQRYYKGTDGISVREISKIGQLYDVGPVTFPAYNSTSAALRDDRTIDAELAKIEAEMQADADAIAAARHARDCRVRDIRVQEISE